MSDLISRQDAIKVVEGIDSHFVEYIEQLPSAQPEQRWIPCSERLPEDVEIGEEYPTAIFCTRDAVYVGFYDYMSGKWWNDDPFYTVGKVIAWMPLPEPYKGE